MITAEVGVTRLTKPDADWNAVTTIDRDTPAKSASGARIGMTSAGCPEDDGTRNAIGMLTRNASTANPLAVQPETALSIQCRIVSVMYELRITTVMRRAKTMISAALRKSEAPAMIVVTVPSSPSFAIRPITTDMTRKRPAASGK